jgi:hypothetical protein
MEQAQPLAEEDVPTLNMLDDFQPDVLLPSQYFGVIANAKHYSPEHRLVMAVLIDAVNCYLSKDEHLHVRAWQWFISPRTYFLSYKSICELLGINPQYLWSQLKDLPRGGKKFKRIDYHSFIS